VTGATHTRRSAGTSEVSSGSRRPTRTTLTCSSSSSRYVHSLSDEEQRLPFGEEAWFFRRILVRSMWRRSFDRFLPYALNQNLVL